MVIGTGFQIDEVLRRWAQTQFEDVRTQLELGARTLDLRFGYDIFGKQWSTVHGVVYGAPARDILEEIKTFLIEQPTELIYLNAREIVNGTEENLKELVEMCLEIFGDMVYSPEKNWMEKKIGDLVDDNNRVFLVFWDPSWGPYEEYPFIFFNHNAEYFFNTYANADTYDNMTNFNEEVIDEFKNLGSKRNPKGKEMGEDNLLLMSWTQTPDAMTIIRSLQETAFISTWEMSQQAYHGFGDFYDSMKEKYEYPIFGHVFIMDYLDETTSETILRPLIEF